MIKLWKRLGMPGQTQFASALGLAALSGASAVFLLGLSGWFLTAAALAGLAGTGLIFNHLFPSAGVRAAAFSRVLSRYGEQLVGHDATLKLSATLRPQLFSAGALSMRGLTPLPSADLSLLLDDVEAAESGFLRVLAPAATVLASVIVAIGFAFAADPLLALITIAAVAVASWAIPARAARRGRNAATRHADDAASAREHVARLVENAVELDVIGALPQACAAAQTRLEAQQSQLDRMEKPFRGLGAFNTLIGTGLALAFLWRASTSDIHLAFAAGAALALMAALDACAAMVKVLDAAPRAAESADRLLKRIDRPAAIAEPDQASAATLTALFPIVLDGLVASAAPQSPRIGPVSVRIAPHTLVDLTGPSGCGKTTLAETLMRLQPPVRGDLSYGGIPASRLRIASILERIASAPQLPAFLPGTLREQFHLANPAATDAQINAALAIAGADGFIARTPDGLAARFDDGEGMFSGGELRRIGLARALLADPQLLILDEPFAGLEPRLAESVSNRLAAWALNGERAILLLQHGPSRFAWPGLNRAHIALGEVERT